jgi:predicted TPR repeat methyltransferase
LVGLGSNIALGRSSHAFRRSDTTAALRLARRAQELAPWSAEPWRRLGDIQLDAGRRSEAARSFRKSLAKDDGDWRTWLGLYRATGDPAARAEARRLNPLIDL